MQTFILADTIIPANGQAPIKQGIVEIVGNRIVSVGTAAEYGEIPSGAEIVDTSGCTVLPGLIDVHVHVFMYPNEVGFSEAAATVWATHYLHCALRGGVTTLRDLASAYDAIFALKQGVEYGWIVGPRLLVAGQGLTMTGGHGWSSGAIEADGAIEVMKAARLQLKKGADVIKLMATGGVGTAGNELPRYPQLSVEEMRAGVIEARKVDKTTTAHAHATIGIKSAIEAGVDCIEHGVYMDDETIAMMVERDVALSPTLSVYHRIIEAGVYDMVPAFRILKARSVVAAHEKSFRQALAAGVRIALGTDAVALHHPLGDVALELELWVEYGMSPLQAIESATRVSAKVCQLEDQIGTLEVGKLADILIVRGDVLADISAIRNVKLVLREGRIVYDQDAASSYRGAVIVPDVSNPFAHLTE